MSARDKAGEGCMIACCACLSMIGLRHENFAMWLGILDEAFPERDGCAPASQNLWDAAARLIDTTEPRARERAHRALRDAMERYFVRVAAHRAEAWKIERDKKNALT